MVVYGPYMPILPGVYSVTMAFDENTILRGAIVEVVALQGKITLKTLRDDELRLSDRHQLVFEFSTAYSIADLEVRLIVFGQVEGCFRTLSIAKADLRWRFDRPDILAGVAAKTERGIVFTRGMSGVVFYGPYVPIRPARTP